jgi:hypothetical protein
MPDPMLARRIVAVALVPYALWLVFAYEYHFIDGVNLVFHEAGHVFFGLLGQTLHMLGGTLMQLLMPLLCAGHFLRQNQRFEPLVCALWFGESLMYTAAYMGDAVHMTLPLVGGEIHDWNWLLGHAGLLRWTGFLAGATHALASALVLGAQGALLWLAFRSEPS